MEQNELLQFVAETLDKLGISYFVTGSFAGILYGEYRMTNDIDVVIALNRDQVDAFLSAFSPEQFYTDRDAAIDAVKTRFQFNVIHRESLAKIDFIIAGGSTHDREAMRRVRRFRGTSGREVAYSAPEDLILKKLVFHKEGASEKHLRDAVGIMKKSGENLDLPYIENWADWLDVVMSWREVQKRANM